MRHGVCLLAGANKHERTDLFERMRNEPNMEFDKVGSRMGKLKSVTFVIVLISSCVLLSLVGGLVQSRVQVAGNASV